jgi:hypothetical protein
MFSRFHAAKIRIYLELMRFSADKFCTYRTWFFPSGTWGQPSQA